MDIDILRRMKCLACTSIAVLTGAIAPMVEATQQVGFYVLCDTATGEMTVAPEHDRGERVVLAGMFPGVRTAEVWIEESCPQRRCDASGLCAGETPPTDLEGWLVLCNQRSGDVGLVNSAVPPGFSMMAGPFATQDEANDWVTGSCPGWRCGDSGQCDGGAAPPPPSAGVGGSPSGTQTGGGSTSGWVAGQVQTSSTGGQHGSSSGAQTGGGWVAGSVSTESGTAGGGGSTTATVVPPTGVVGPQSARPDVTPLASAAAAAVAGCSFPTALANAEQMELIEPGNLWLSANYDRLRQLAARQKTTEQAVWRASSALQNGDLKSARNATMAAADTAVSCQSQAVSILLTRIDETIAHRKTEKGQARQRAAGQLLAGLLVLNQAVTAKYGGSGTTPSGGIGTSTGTSIPSLGLGAPPGTDPCAFKYEYRNKWNTEPFCTCPGYKFDPGQFRCVAGG